jgi:hypothetical protein
MNFQASEVFAYDLESRCRDTCQSGHSDTFRRFHSLEAVCARSRIIRRSCALSQCSMLIH